MIGKTLMHKDGYSNMSLKNQKLYILRQFCVDSSGFYDKITDTYSRIVTMNLDTNRTSMEFTSSVQIANDVCAQYLIFTNYAPADINFYAAHIGYKSIIGFALLEYIVSNRKKIHWTDPASVDPCIGFLQGIRDTFFQTDGEDLQPNHSLFPETQKSGFLNSEVIANLNTITDKKTYKKERDKVIKKYFERDIASITGKKPAYAITIDGKFIHEHELTSACYLDVLYYHFFEKQFTNSKAKGSCHLCSLNGELAEDVSLKQKFYGSSNPMYFDRLSNNRSYSAFSLCEECYKELIVGIQFASNKLKTRILGLNSLVLPEIDNIQIMDIDSVSPTSLKSIINVLKHNNKAAHQQDLQIIKDIQMRLSKFSLFFYSKPSATSQEFIIGKFIKGISIKSVIDKTDDLDRLTLENKLVDVFNTNYGLNIEGLRYLLLPSVESHPNLRPKDPRKPPDYQQINREILSLLSKYLYSHEFDYKKLIRNFVDIFARKYIHVDDQFLYGVDLSPFVMSLYLKHLTSFSLVKIITRKEDKIMTTMLEDPEILKYFENNAETYLNNRYAQGLFILGKYISEIEFEQSKKNISKTAISKVNLRGLPVQRVKSTMATMDELRDIWVNYNNLTTDAYYRECMTGIETSTLSPEEVIFHILSGRAYSKYVGILMGKLKKQNAENNQTTENNQEEENDQE